MHRNHSNDDILRSLRGRNPYVPHDAEALLPPPPPLPIATSSTASANATNASMIPPNHRTAIQPTTAATTKPDLDNLLQIKLIKGRTKDLREWEARLVSKSDPLYVKDALCKILKQNKITMPIDNFLFQYKTTKKGADSTINEYDVTNLEYTNPTNFYAFVLRQVTETTTDPVLPTAAPTATTSKEYNKRKYEERNRALADAELVLKRRLDWNVFCDLKNNGRLFLSVKYKLGIQGLSFEDVENEIFGGLYDNKRMVGNGKRYRDITESDPDFRDRKKRRLRSPEPASDPFKQMMQMMQLNMMNNINMQMMQNQRQSQQQFLPQVQQQLAPRIQQQSLPQLPPILPPIQTPNITPLSHTIPSYHTSSTTNNSQRRPSILSIPQIAIEPPVVAQSLDTADTSTTITDYLHELNNK